MLPQQEVEIVYTEQAILDKLIAYKLKPAKVYANTQINVVQLSQLDVDETSGDLQALSLQLKHWQPSPHLTAFTAQINQLIYGWLHAFESGVSTQKVFNYLQCVALKSTFDIASTSKLQCFLFDLVADTNQQYQQLKLDFILHFDANTQLPNASQIPYGIEKTLSKLETNQPISFLAMHFQLSKNSPINAQLMSLGLGKKIAELLLKNVPEHCTLYYSGHLQFDLLAPALTNEIQLNLLVAKLQRAFEHMEFVENQSILITPFIGCAIYKKNNKTSCDIFNHARLALENALSIQQHFVFYTDELTTQLNTKNTLENVVLDAFNNDHLELFFQPVVHIEDLSCVGAELLLRCSAKAGFNVHPSLVVEILNKIGKGKQFSRWLINSACRYVAELKYEHQANLYLTINLRAEDLYDIELPHLLEQSLVLWKIEAKNIVLEVTENGVLEHNDSSNAVIDQLSKLGFKLALDDFGTGFSSLSRLRNMPIDIIKIDQTFVRDITHSKDDYEIVKSIAALASSLGKEVIAEGVEDKKCLNLIKKMQIQKCQGYYFAKPMPFEKFLDWLKSS